MKRRAGWFERLSSEVTPGWLKVVVVVQGWFFLAQAVGNARPDSPASGVLWVSVGALHLVPLVALWRLRRWSVYGLAAVLAFYFATHAGVLVAAPAGVLAGVVSRSVALAASMALWSRLTPSRPAAGSDKRGPSSTEAPSAVPELAVEGPYRSVDSASNSSQKPRAEALDEHGLYTMDAYVLDLACRSCAGSLSKGDMHDVPFVEYTTREEIVAFACSLTLQPGELPRCEKCNGVAAVRRLSFHSFHSGLKKDLVVRCMLGAALRVPHHELWTWSASEGYRLLDGLSKSKERRLTRDALLRGAVLSREGTPDRTVLNIGRLLEESPGDPELLTFGPWLLEAGEWSLAAAIGRAHVEKNPEDPQGYVYLAEGITFAMRRGKAPHGSLEAASELLESALQLNPNHPAALAAKVNLAPMSGQDEIGPATE